MVFRDFFWCVMALSHAVIFIERRVGPLAYTFYEVMKSTQKKGLVRKKIRSSEKENNTDIKSD